MVKVWEILINAVIINIGYYIMRYLEEKIYHPDNFKKWKDWKKYNTNNPIYKLFVLFGWQHSPTFDDYFIFKNFESKAKTNGWKAEIRYKDVKWKKEKIDG